MLALPYHLLVHSASGVKLEPPLEAPWFEMRSQCAVEIFATETPGIGGRNPAELVSRLCAAEAWPGHAIQLNGKGGYG